MTTTNLKEQIAWWEEQSRQQVAAIESLRTQVAEGAPNSPERQAWIDYVVTLWNEADLPIERRLEEALQALSYARFPGAAARADMRETLLAAQTALNNRFDIDLRNRAFNAINRALMLPDVAARPQWTVLDDYRSLVEAIDHTLSIHGHMDADTPLHDRLRRTLALPCGGVAQAVMDPATVEACAKIAENNGWEATAAQIRALALPSTVGRYDP